MVLKKDIFLKEEEKKKERNNQTETRSKTGIFLEPSREDPSQQGFPRSVHTDNSTGLGFGSHGKPAAAELLRSCQQQQHPLPAPFPPRQQSPRAANMAWNRRIPPLSDTLKPPGSPQPHALLAPPLGFPLGQTQNTSRNLPQTHPTSRNLPHIIASSCLCPAPASASPAAILTSSAGLRPLQELQGTS